jgi:hypothetical protein
VTNASYVAFTPLTDTVGALSQQTDAGISIGALTVQPGGTGVILAGTGDPNDALDSYYGAGILRSADGGNSWTLIDVTADLKYSFVGEGFAGFAWSTTSPQLVVAAVSQAYQGTLVNANFAAESYEGLYYSADAGVTWKLATITDGGSSDIQGPNDPFVMPDGNAATSVVWNPVRQMFMAAVRYHGYYQSFDGKTWTRMAAQPGTELATTPVNFCPTNPGEVGSVDCPIFRGTLAVNPQTGDTFAWTVDAYNQDQGLFQDACAISGSACTNQTVTFAKQWSTQSLEANTSDGPVTIENGDYTLALTAAPAGLGQGEDTILLAGDLDLWRCSLAEGCVWRNTTNSSTCMSGQVGPFQHALAWSTVNPLEIFVGSDSGLWRSLDSIGETGQVCAPTDAAHFQNLNGGLGSLAESVSLALDPATPYTMMTGLGVNGTAGIKTTTAPVTGTAVDWPEILGGFGGPVAIDPRNSENWYVNNAAGVSIYLCSEPNSSCTPADFGSSPVVTDADVGGDGYTMGVPAPFLVDPVDSTQLLIGTCRVWRGPANGVGWSGTNAISGVLDSGAATSCNGDALIRSMAATGVTGGNEVVYLGMYGSLNGGANLPGHVLSANFNPSSNTTPTWTDLTLNPVSNDSRALNFYGLDISSIFIDPHDTTGNTVYVTVEGIRSTAEPVEVIYRSTDGGAHWAQVVSNLPLAPANSVVVDPQNASTVYVGTDVGVYFTTGIANCANQGSDCWSVFGTGLPEAPVTQLSASSALASAQVLTAATYGRGIWQTGLWTGGTGLTTVSASPPSLTFAGQSVGSTSAAQTVTLTNTGSGSLTVTEVAMGGDFSETDNCQNQTVAAGNDCTLQVSFTPSVTGNETGQMTVSANVYGGQLTVALSGTGTPGGSVILYCLTSTTICPQINFDQALSGPTLINTPEASLTPLPVTLENTGTTAITITSIVASAPFGIVSPDSCLGSGDALAAGAACQIKVIFDPTATGAAAGTLIVTDSAGVQTVALTGTGVAPPTDTLNPTSLSFPNTVEGQLSAAMPVLLTNTGGLPLTAISTTITSGPFQVSNNCGTTLTGPGSCSIAVVFAPTTVGTFTGTLTVGDITRAQPQTVALNGTGVPPPILSVSPTSLTLTSTLPGVQSAPGTLTITNSGGSSMANVGFQITGLSASSFATGTTTCGATLAVNASCTVQVTFTPASTGSSTAILTVSSSTPGVASVNVPLTGTDVEQSGLNVSPTTLSFSAETVGQTSAAQTVTVSNSTVYAASTLTFTATSGFTVTPFTCQGSLSAASSCTVGVSFAPTASGAATGILTVSSGSFSAPATVALSGTGAFPAAIQVTPSNFAFGEVGVGVASTPATLTVTNPGSLASVTGLTLTVPAGFQLVNNTCAATLAAASSCTAGVEFTPTITGAQSGNLTVSATGLNSVTVPMTGTGFDFTLGLSGSGSQTVTSGQTASYTVTIKPLNGSSGTFTFACDTVPLHSSCSFNPSSETVSAGGTGNVAVEIITGQTSALLVRPGGWRLLPLLCGMILLPWGWRRRRKLVCLAALLLVLTAGASSCVSSGGGSSGGSGGGTGANTTPSGTYTVPITVTANGIEHSQNVTLVVD